MSVEEENLVNHVCKLMDELDDTRKKFSDATSELDDMKKKLSDATSELDDAKKKHDDKIDDMKKELISELNDMKKKLDDAMSDLFNMKKKHDEIDNMKKQLAEFDDMKKKVNSEVHKICTYTTFKPGEKVVVCRFNICYFFFWLYFKKLRKGTEYND